MYKSFIFIIMISFSIQKKKENIFISADKFLTTNPTLKIPETENNNFKIKKKLIASSENLNENLNEILFRDDRSIESKVSLNESLTERFFNDEDFYGTLLTENYTRILSEDQSLSLNLSLDDFPDKSNSMPVDEDEYEDVDQLSSSRESLNHFHFSSQSKTCRTRDGRYLPPVLFAWDTCAHCYLFELGKKYHLEAPWTVQMRSHDLGFTAVQVLLLRNITNSMHVIEANVSNHDLFLTVRDTKFRTQWKRCCLAAISCCESMQFEPIDLPSNSTNYCPRTWDGWQCWKDTIPDSESFEPCPVYSYIDTSPTCVKMAKKTCDSTGMWFRRSGREWTDYSTCGLLPNIKIRMYCHILALSLSILALVPALLIFCCFRQLRVQRITLHKQLFASLLLESCFTLAFRFLELHGSTIIKVNPIWCITITMLRIYARQTNYAWYLCEGFYLHRLLASSFAKQKSLALYYVIGWVLPIIPTGLYGVFRGLWYESSHCWNIPVDGLEWLIQIPPLLAMMVNLVFIVHVMRILLSKVKAKNVYEPYQFRMALRATMMVVPLFGLQYIITIYRPKGQTCDWHDMYHIINNVIDGSTGLIVAIIFCFANNEVRTLCVRSWRRLKEKHETHTFRDHLGSLLRSRSLSTVHTTILDSHSASHRASSQQSMNASHSNSMIKNIKEISSTEHLKLSLPQPKESNHRRTNSMPSDITFDINYDASETTPENSKLIQDRSIYYIEEESKDTTTIFSDSQDYNLNLVDEEFNKNHGLL